MRQATASSAIRRAVSRSIAAGVLLAGAAGCASTSVQPPNTAAPSGDVVPSGDVMLIGDSLADQAAPYLASLLPGRRLVSEYFGGTAPCDWLTKHGPITAGSTVVISFTGNSLTPCMADAAGGHLAGVAVVNRYRADVTTLTAQAVAARAHVLLVGQPVHIDLIGGNDIVRALNTIYAAMAAPPEVEYVDAGTAVENVDGSFAHALPCLAGEPTCGPSGSNAVRSDDGLHFCPGGPGPGACAGYSSGAFRFASAIASVIEGA